MKIKLISFIGILLVTATVVGINYKKQESGLNNNSDTNTNSNAEYKKDMYADVKYNDEEENEDEGDDDSSTQNTVKTTPTNTVPTNTSSSKTYTMTEVTKHNSSTSCWTVVGSKVYDVTSWISKHPGGSKNIMKICGIDRTAQFSQQHGSSAKAQNALASFYIGEIK